jgi:ATP-binding cassette subfamily B protein
MVIASLSEILTITSFVPLINAILEKTYENNFLSKFSFKFLNNFGLDFHENEKSFLFLIFFLFVIFNLIIRTFVSWFNVNLIKNFINEISKKTFTNLLRQNYEFFLSNNSNKFLSLFVNKIDNTFSFFYSSLMFFSSFLISIGIIFSLTIINSTVTVFTLIILIIVYSLLILFIKKKINYLSKIISDNYDYRIKSILQSLQNTREIILSQTKDFYIKNYLSYEYKIRNADAKLGLYNSFPRFFFETLGILIISVVAYFLIELRDYEQKSIISSLAILTFASQKLLMTFNTMYISWIGLSSNKIQTHQIIEILKLEEEIKINNPKTLNDDFKKIQLINVSFRYQNSNFDSLKNVNIQIKKGSVIGLTGETGSGKTSLLDIICGLLKPTSGNVLLNGDSFHKNSSSWQKKIGYVPQNIYISESSILENIVMLSDINNVNYDKLIKACTIANCIEFILKYKSQFNTLVGENGIRLSGGQIQRIGIARALYKDPDILLLDESTSALDEQTEKKIIKDLVSDFKNKTILIISHNHEVLKFCEKIIFIKDGTIMHDGSLDSYNMLIKKI